MSFSTNRSGESPFWSIAVIQAATWGICSGVTLYVLSNHHHPTSFSSTSFSSTSFSSIIQARSAKRNDAALVTKDWVSMLCAVFQPRVFMSFVLWRTFWQPQGEEGEQAKGHESQRQRGRATATLVDDLTIRENKKKDRPKKKKRRYLELLVHNVSHTDLILGLEPVSSTSTKSSLRRSASDDSCNESSFILCRPRFSRFHKYSLKVFQNLAASSLLLLPCYQRRYDSPRYSIILRKSAQRDPEYHQHPPTPTGLQLGRPLSVDNSEVRVRGRDYARLQPKMQLCQVFFPLLASLLPRWKQQIELKHGSGIDGGDAANTGGVGSNTSNIHRVLVLVSGVGTPRDSTHDPQGNSTEVCAQLMKHFIQVADPTITVVHIHSDWNIFRYDENVRFVKEIFMPRIHAYRDAHARGLRYPHETQIVSQHMVAEEPPFQEDWRNTFTTTLSWADGTNARTYAIQCGLRDYRPFYFHFWQLKTFWHECKIVIDDIEVHSYAAMELIPPVDTNLLPAAQEDNADIARVVDEIKAFRQEVQDMLLNDNHELSRFWLRQTRKPVLAVLLVRSHNSEAMIYRGTNMEVSMPTGSLCAERNVIGTALASNPSLKRQDLKVLAVLAVPFDEPDTRKPSNFPYTASSASLDQASRKSSIGSETDNTEWHLTNPLPVHESAGGGMPMESSFMMVPSELSSAQLDEDDEPLARRIDLFSSATTQSTMRTVLLKQSSRRKDLNPLAPCGACNEWLKKIAESNPYFKILTFTDCQCHGVYITPCKDS